MGDLPGHPFRGNQYTDTTLGGVQRGDVVAEGQHGFYGAKPGQVVLNVQAARAPGYKVITFTDRTQTSGHKGMAVKVMRPADPESTVNAPPPKVHTEWDMERKASSGSGVDDSVLAAHGLTRGDWKSLSADEKAQLSGSTKLSLSGAPGPGHIDRGLERMRADRADVHTAERITKGGLGGRGRMSKSEFNRLADAANRGTKLLRGDYRAKSFNDFGDRLAAKSRRGR